MEMDSEVRSRNTEGEWFCFYSDYWLLTPDYNLL